MNPVEYARWFRSSTPYISAHRGKTFVVLLPGDAFDHPNLIHVVQDLALLHVLGARIVLVHGARPQIDAALGNGASTFHNGNRITDADGIDVIAGIHGQLRTALEARFATGLPNTPLHNVDIPVVSGNFVFAQPLGVIDGVDHLFTGRVRRVETDRIERILATGALVLQSPIGFSASGQPFNLTAESVARDIASALNADKLICFAPQHVTDDDGARVSTLTPATAEDHTDAHPILAVMSRAVRGGVGKAHLVSFAQDGGLLTELFTAEGGGTQLVEQLTRGIRTATPADVSAIVEVIRPLEEDGILVRRERDRLEQEIERFLVAEIDGIVVGCCAVFPSGDGTQAELACVAVHEDYRARSGARIGQRLLAAAEDAARTSGAQALFVLTTQTADWFTEQGFVQDTVDALPPEKQTLYNWQRNSIVLTKSLNPQP